MAKMYYTEAEAAEKLRKTPAELIEMARQKKLHVYADGTNKMYKVAEVDALAGPADLAGESDIQLTPADSVGASGTRIALSDADRPTKAPGKGDTVITSEGISIFDDEELEIETADPMAKTQIAPSLEDQISLEGVGSGSGLLDLTRESDDTSLGEVLDHIDVAGGEASAPPEMVAESISLAETETIVEQPVLAYERPDPSAGAFAGMIAVGALLMVLVSAVALAVLTGRTPEYVTTLGENLPIVVGVVAVATVIAAVIGLVLGKSAAGRAATAR